MDSGRPPPGSARGVRAWPSGRSGRCAAVDGVAGEALEQALLHHHLPPPPPSSAGWKMKCTVPSKFLSPPGISQHRAASRYGRHGRRHACSPARSRHAAGRLLGHRQASMSARRPMDRPLSAAAQRADQPRWRCPSDLDPPCASFAATISLVRRSSKPVPDARGNPAAMRSSRRRSRRCGRRWAWGPPAGPPSKRNGGLVSRWKPARQRRDRRRPVGLACAA